MKKTAIILLGYQNDFFAPNGILNAGVKENLEQNGVLENTVEFLDEAVKTDALIITTPIAFSAEYRELHNPSGLMATIRDLGAFRSDSYGGQTIPEIEKYGDRIIEVSGKHGFNAFHNTQLNQILQVQQVEEIIIMGVVTSVCVDSTGRSASERGYQVKILSDCTAGRSHAEHDFYSKEIFPLYAQVSTSKDLMDEIIPSKESVPLAS